MKDVIGMDYNSLLLHSIHTRGIVHLLFLLSESLAGSLMFGHCPPHGSGLLLAKVQRLVLLFPVQFPQILALVVVDHRQYPCYGLPNDLTGRIILYKLHIPLMVESSIIVLGYDDKSVWVSIVATSALPGQANTTCFTF